MIRKRTAAVCLALALSGSSRFSAFGQIRQGPPPELRAHIDALVHAFNSGSADKWEEMARDHCTPAYLKRVSAEGRKREFQRWRADLGDVEVTQVMREAPDAPVRMSVKGAKGQDGTFELQLEPDIPFRIDSISVRVGAAADGAVAAPLPPPPVNGGMSSEALQAPLDAWLKRLDNDDLFSGVVLLAKEDAPVFLSAYGYADRCNRVPNTPSTRFNIGSIDKVFTQIAIEQLITRGRLKPTDTIANLLRDYPQPLSRPANVTQLLNHTAGIADFFGEQFARSAKDQFRSNSDYYRLVSTLPPTFAPGARSQYCNGCYIVLGEIIARVTGIPYENYIQENLFQPAGMHASGWFQSDAINPQVAMGYTLRKGNGGLRSNIFLHGASGSAAGGGYATALDLFAFTIAMKQGKIPDSKRFSGFGIAGGAPGTNSILEQSNSWTVIVLANLDPPAAENVGRALLRALSRPHA